jgi:glycogen debranching enzyme
MHNDIAHSIAIKDGNLFFITDADGSVPLERGHGFGLYHNDCRFLDGYELKIAGQKFALQKGSAEEGNAATIDLRSAELHVRWSRKISGEHLTLIDTIAIQNLTSETISLPLTLSFQSHFDDIFGVRGVVQQKRGTLLLPKWRNGALYLCYEGADEIDRDVAIRFSILPADTEENAAKYEFKLPANETDNISISLRICEKVGRDRRSRRTARRAVPTSAVSFEDKVHQPLALMRICTDDSLLNRMLDQSLRDLRMLRSNVGAANYFAAGVPWYVALFGRDSIITALQMLAFDAGIAEQTIRLLAHYQGKEVNPWRDEEPGKILHELRVGEMAHLNEIPHTPYYGTIDATPLWLVLIGRHAAWTGDLRVFNELRPNIEAALRWIEEDGDLDGDGYVEYQCKSEGGLVHQGWKDSADGIVDADGSLGEPSIALVEVQGYVYRAKLEIASLFRRAGDQKRAAKLETEAQRLRERFNRDFWVDEGYYALALQKEKPRVQVLSSNAGQALWSGIADVDHANETADRLLSPEMFSGWGVRTLSSKAIKYDPLGYHLGTVWPHDNSLVTAGLKNYGFDSAALRILSGMIAAAQHFDACRLPELFGGVPRENNIPPSRYPIACQPQAWAAGAIPYMLTSVLGLEPEAFEAQLRIVRPMLPENVDRLEIHDLRVGTASIDLLFERGDNGVTVRVREKRGTLEIIADAMV